MMLFDAVTKANRGSRKLRRKEMVGRVVGGSDFWLDITDAWDGKHLITSGISVFESGKLVQRPERYPLFVEDLIADDWEVKP